MKTSARERVLITGANGMLGLTLSAVLARKGFEVVGLYHDRPGRLADLARVRSYQADLTSRTDIQKIQKDIPIVDIIIHCAAMTNVDQCELNKKQCQKINVKGTEHVVDLARQYGARLIFISTPMVFSGKQGNYKESSSTQPLNYYAKTKLTAEQRVRRYKQSLIIRANPIGVRPVGSFPSFIQWFVDMAHGNKSFSLFSDVLTNPISTLTLADLMVQFIRDFKPGILHLGSHDVANKADIWQLIVAQFPDFSGIVKTVSVDQTKAGKIAPRPKDMSLNVERVIKMGYKMPSWRQEVRKTLREIAEGSN